MTRVEKILFAILAMSYAVLVYLLVHQIATARGL